MDVKKKCCNKGLLLVYQYFVDRGYSNSEITIINKYSKQMPDDDKEIVDGLYKIDVLIYSVRQKKLRQDPNYCSLINGTNQSDDQLFFHLGIW